MSTTAFVGQFDAFLTSPLETPVRPLLRFASPASARLLKRCLALSAGGGEVKLLNRGVRGVIAALGAPPPGNQV